MLTAEHREEYADLLSEARTLLIEDFAATEWGRLLVHMKETPGGLRVSAVDVEEIVGDEGLVERVFQSSGFTETLFPLGKVVEALSALSDVDLGTVEGGTFVRNDANDTFSFLPGLVRAPSSTFDRARDAVEQWRFEALAALRAKHGFAGDETLRVDLEEGHVEFRRDGEVALRLPAVLVATFSREPRTFAWGGKNPSLPHAAQAASVKLVDDLLDRTAWELSTPYFATDRDTARAIAAYVAKLSGCGALLELSREDGDAYFAVEP
jgi:hypothetical protein